MTEIKTAVAKDGRILPVLEKDYKKLYEQLQEKQRLKDESYRRSQVKKETADSTGFGGTSRCTSFKHKRREENQKQQQGKRKRPAPILVNQQSIQQEKTQLRSPSYHPNYTGPEPDSSEFDSAKHGLLALPRTRHLLNGKYID